MPTYYLESSALFKRYRTEPGTQVMDILFGQRSPGDRFVTSEIIVIEAEATAARSLPDSASRDVLAELFARDMLQIDTVELTMELKREASKAARSFKLRALDAIHFASALESVGIGPLPVVMVTSDHEIIQAGKAAGLAVLDPTDVNAPHLLQSLRDL